jgi:hypothetical protein
VSSSNWICDRCQKENPAGAPLCIHCEATPDASHPEPSRSPRRYPLWLAAVIPATLFVVFATVSMLRVSQRITADPSIPVRDPSRASCVETYGITLNQSEYYVREYTSAFSANKPNGSTPELSTVLKGMAHNTCGENLKNVRLHMVVHDADGRKGDGFFLIQNIADGEVQSFERAWMGRVVTYEVTADH